MSRPHILICEDDADIQQLVSFYLIKSGFSAICADTGEQAIEILEKENVNCLLLDLMLPGMDGLEVCRRIRASKGRIAGLPVIMLTARGEDNDIVTGLEAGADDYVAKPFSPGVLISRVRALLRRRGDGDISCDNEENSRLVSGSIVLDFETYQAEHAGTPLDLTMTEFRILALLMEKPGRVYTRDRIIEAVRGYGYSVTPRSVDVQIHGIRKKLGSDSRLVETVRGVGYRFTGESG